MDISKISKDELELLSYKDIAYHIIKKAKEPKQRLLYLKRYVVF